MEKDDEETGWRFNRELDIKTLLLIASMLSSLVLAGFSLYISFDRTDLKTSNRVEILESDVRRLERSQIDSRAEGLDAVKQINNKLDQLLLYMARRPDMKEWTR